MATKTGIREKQRFYNRMVFLGVDLATFNPDNINFEGTKHKSSFKRSPDTTKQKHNHVFNFRNRETDYFVNFPDITKITFFKK